MWCGMDPVGNGSLWDSTYIRRRGESGSGAELAEPSRNMGLFR